MNFTAITTPKNVAEAVSLVTFTGPNDATIACTNPWLAENGRDVVEPSYYGFKMTSTGGGCIALELATDDGLGGHLILTDLDGVDVPKQHGIGGWMLGRFDVEGTQVALIGCDADGNQFAFLGQGGTPVDAHGYF